MIRAFVSSTYRDLKDHRAYVIDRLARSGILVDPMEKWTAASDEPKVLSQERVRDCQLCILLVGFTRGHISQGETRSITQLEYAEALRRGITVLTFMASEEADWPETAFAGLESDPELARWRSDLKEHSVIGFFSTRPESIDVDAAVARWLQEQLSPAAHRETDPQATDVTAIDIRAHSNSEGVLLVWRTDGPIKCCLGFALQKEVLGDAGITQEIVSTRLGFSAPQTQAHLKPSSSQPIQNFRWLDREQREVRYRVLPILGTPNELAAASDDHARSPWTGWVSPRTGQNPACRAYFNAALQAQAVVRTLGANPSVPLMRQDRAKVREQLGAGLRRRLLELLASAKLAGRRVYAAFTDADDPEVIAALTSLGENLRLILGSPPGEAAKTRKALRSKAHLYEPSRALRSNFLVSCDRWGTPLSVWTGSAAPTTEALCLRSNNSAYIESVPLARVYLDRWQELADDSLTRRGRPARREAPAAEIREDGSSITVWNTPAHDQADLRDVRRLIRGARQGVLFLVSGRRFAKELMEETLGLVGDRDLFIEGVLCVARGRTRAEYTRFINGDRQLIALPRLSVAIDSTIVLVDPFGPHPVVIIGSHDLSEDTSAKELSDLVIIENVPSLAIEYAVHLIGVFDHFTFRHALASAPQRGRTLLLDSSDAWQERYFRGNKRSEFSLLFGSLSPGDRKD